MDPLTQISIGAAAAVSLTRKPVEVRHALILGALAGGAPDLDVLIRSSEDPLLALEYHRHFTHALLFAPVIGALVALLYRFIFARKSKIALSRFLIFGMVATLTHGFIDACTSYGTLLYWPLINHRESWDIISIIDPIFTVPLVGLLIFAFVLRKKRLAQVGLALCGLYLCFGIVQREQAEHFARGLAEQRGHRPTELTARPSFGNVLVWRILYRDEDKYYVDAVRVLPFAQPHHYPGAVVAAFTELDAYSLVNPDSVLWNDIERFRFFSQGYLYLHGSQPAVAGDLRYALFPDSVVPLWGITVHPNASDAHTDMVYFREASSAAFNRLWQMIKGQPVAPFHPMPDGETPF